MLGRVTQALLLCVAVPDVAAFIMPVRPLGPPDAAGRTFRRWSVAAEREPLSTSSRTYEILSKIKRSDDSAGAGSSIDVEGLKRLDAAWEGVRTGAWSSGPAPQFISEVESPVLGGASPEFDVAVAGGTMGIFMACALQLRGFRVCVVERGVVAGRSQDWNVSEKEIREFVHLGVFSEEELKEIIGISFNPIRVRLAVGGRHSCSSAATSLCRNH